MSSHCVGGLFGSQGFWGMVDDPGVDVQPKPDQVDGLDTLLRCCQVCSKPAQMTLSETHGLCRKCALGLRVSGDRRVRFFRAAVG
jgi:hypothetical protein